MDIDFESDAHSQFKTDDDNTMTYCEYYHERYHVDIRQPRLPLIVSRVKGRDGKKMEVRLIPELCQIAGMDSISPGDRAKIMRSLCRETIPTLRMNYIHKVLRRLSDCKGGTHFPLTIGNDPVSIDGRRLDEPLPGTPTGKFRMQWRQVGRSPVYRVLQLRRWIVVTPDNIDVSRFLDSVSRNLHELGLDPVRAQIEKFPSRGQQNDVVEAELLLNRLDLHGIQLVMVLVSNYATGRFYSMIKRALCDVYGIPSQFVKERNVREAKMSVIGKIGVQIACKIGCEAWTICGGFGESFKNSMIVGIDCHHARGGTSVAGIVCSLNDTISRFYSRCYYQTEGQELATTLTVCLKEAIERYSRLNKRYPSSVIVFRDGIGDGQLQYIGQSECQQILNAFDLLPDKGDGMHCPPNLTYIVVRKRLNARFFAQDNRGLNNPEGGLVIDRVVTMERWRDFYLVPQRVTQGTATPSHFNILADHSKFSMDEIQNFSYRLCFMYFNWSGAIRVPCVCQYAHKLAFLTGTCCKREPKEVLHERLYYL
ncbi:hypothetical protein ACOME3_006558 [Neoechinorhynchus agilis]